MKVQIIAMRSCAIILLVLSMLAAFGVAQTSTGTLRGRVTDPSGAVIPQANVTITASNGKSVTATTNQQGIYEVKELAPGSYNVTVTAKGFAADQEADVKVAAGEP